MRIFEIVILVSLWIALTTSSLAGGAGVEGSLKWRYLADSEYHSPPAVGPAGTIYYGSGNFLIALNADGQLKWKNKTGGLVSSPTIGPDGSIYAASTGLYCFDSNGTLKWTYSTGCYDFQTPAIGLNGTIYFPSGNGNLYAFNPNGTIRWSYKIGYRPSSPAIDFNGTIYVCGNNSTYAINPDGTSKWSFVTGPSASPIIGSGDMIYVGSNLNGLYGLNQNGTLMWHNATAKISSSPTVGLDGSIYVGSITGCIYAFTPNGKLKWCYPTKGAVRYPPTVGSDGVLYASADSVSCLYAINSNGSLRWQYQTGGITNSAPTLSPNGTLYVGSADKYLYAFNTSSRLANSSWPMFQHDAQHSGRTGWPPYIGLSIIPSNQGQGAPQSTIVSQKVFSIEMDPSKQGQGAPQASTQSPMPQTQAGNALYIDAGAQGSARFISASQHSKLTLIAETPIGGQGEVFELYPTSGDQTTYAISAYNFNPGKNNLQYSAEVPGMHYLFVSINKQPSNVIIIEVQGGSGTGNGLGQPLSSQPNPSEGPTGFDNNPVSTTAGTIPPGSAKVTTISNWLKGYSIEVDGIQVGVDGSGSDALDGVFKFYVTGDQQHSIKVNHPQFWKSWNDFFMASRSYDANIDIPGRVEMSS